MIALDSSVLLDILIGDPVYGEVSEICIGDALARDEVVVCDAVVAEVLAMLDTQVDLMETLASIGVRYEATQEAAAVRAGHMNKRFRARGGKRERVVADFDRRPRNAPVRWVDHPRRGLLPRLLQGLEDHRPQARCLIHAF